MPTIREIVTAKNFARVVQILGILGAFGCGSFALFLLMWTRPEGLDAIRVSIAYSYIIIFAIIIPAAELGFMRHHYLGHFATFMLSHIGRAFLYIFMGGLLLGNPPGGLIVGIYMIIIGVLNILAACMRGKGSEGEGVQSVT